MRDSWRDQILAEFIPDIHPITLVTDPDNLVTEENTLQAIQQRGFTVLLYDDPIEFRYVFETRFRGLWEEQKLQDLAIISRISDTSSDPFPYDFATAGYRLSFSLSMIFP